MSLWSVDLQSRADFFAAYMECALWSSNAESTPEGGEPLDLNYGFSDISKEAKDHMREDCNVFIRNNHFDLMEVEPEQAGRDFWLTRNGHGAGFWDRGLGELGDRLTRAAHAFPEVNLYVGDDGKLYLA